MIWEVTSYSGFSQNSDVPPSDEMIINPLGVTTLPWFVVESSRTTRLT